jgi:Pectate lyase superfamily protein
MRLTASPVLFASSSCAIRLLTLLSVLTTIQTNTCYAQARGLPSARFTDASRFATLHDAVAATADNGIVYLPAGTYIVPRSLVITRNVSLVGAGPERTFLLPTAGNAAAAIRYAPATTISAVQISGFTLNLVNARLLNGIELENVDGPSVHNVRVYYGAIGLAVTATGTGHFHDLRRLPQNFTKRLSMCLGQAANPS